MCLICVEWSKGRMTKREVMRAIGELIIDGDVSEHIDEIIEMVDNESIEE